MIGDEAVNGYCIDYKCKMGRERAFQADRDELRSCTYELFFVRYDNEVDNTQDLYVEVGLRGRDLGDTRTVMMNPANALPSLPVNPPNPSENTELSAVTGVS
ncbi:hypothetical protein [Nocardia fluminea]|uniref:hypothetical protein n=1 Tax=Nocardia fluminea TaxID=134984 RepID=UPI000C7124E4|nr:hypothetical protein [Nocardia fluminea]